MTVRALFKILNWNHEIGVKQREKGRNSNEISQDNSNIGNCHGAKIEKKSLIKKCDKLLTEFPQATFFPPQNFQFTSLDDGTTLIIVTVQ